MALVDKDSACVWEVYQDEMRELENIRGQALRRSGYTDRLDEYRGRNKADELTKRHYRNVAQVLEDLFRPGEFDLLIIGGHDYEVPAFTEFLSPGLRSALAGTFSVDPGAARLAAIRAHADEILARYERDAGQRLVADLEDRVVAGGLAAAAWAPACGRARWPPCRRWPSWTARRSRAWSATTPAGWACRGTPARCAAGRPGRPRT